MKSKKIRLSWRLARKKKRDWDEGKQKDSQDKLQPEKTENKDSCFFKPVTDLDFGPSTLSEKIRDSEILSFSLTFGR